MDGDGDIAAVWSDGGKNGGNGGLPKSWGVIPKGAPGAAVPAAWVAWMVLPSAGLPVMGFPAKFGGVVVVVVVGAEPPGPCPPVGCGPPGWLIPANKKRKKASKSNATTTTQDDPSLSIYGLWPNVYPPPKIVVTDFWESIDDRHLSCCKVISIEFYPMLFVPIQPVLLDITDKMRSWFPSVAFTSISFPAH